MQSGWNKAAGTAQDAKVLLVISSRVRNQLTHGSNGGHYQDGRKLR